MRSLLLAAAVLEIGLGAELRIAVYDRANLSEGTRRTAFDVVERIFRSAGIQIAWNIGPLEAEEAALLTYPSRPIRGQGREAACAARRDIALEILDDAPAGLRGSILGMSQPLAREGLNVRIFNDRVEQVAYRESRQHASVLGHAIAHEVGHVLLRSIDHQRQGIMSASWAKHEWELMRSGSLQFDRAQGRKMDEVLGGYGCSIAQSNHAPVAVK